MENKVNHIHVYKGKLYQKSKMQGKLLKVTLKNDVLRAYSYCFFFYFFLKLEYPVVQDLTNLMEQQKMDEMLISGRNMQ